MDAMSCQTQSRIDEVEQHRCWSGGAGHLDGKVRVAAMQFCGVLDNLWGLECRWVALTGTRTSSRQESLIRGALYCPAAGTKLTVDSMWGWRCDIRWRNLWPMRLAEVSDKAGRTRSVLALPSDCSLPSGP